MGSKLGNRILITMIIVATAIFPNTSNANPQTFNSWEEACSSALTNVEEGDLIFTDIPHYLFRQIANTTNTWTSHVGIAFRNDDGAWVIRESKVPYSQETPLCNFIKRSAPYLFEIRRLKTGLNAVEISKMKAFSAQLLNRPYDFGFNFNSKKMYCSKFTFLVFNSVKIEVGRIETFRDLIKANTKSQIHFWNLWFLGSIPWDRQTVTPASQLTDEQFVTVLKGAMKVN